MLAIEALVASNPDLGRKLDFAFGKATGSQHNIQRTAGNLKELSRIGLADTPENRLELAKAFADNLTKGVFKGFDAQGNVIRESFFMGPKGGVIIHAIWRGNKLITFWFLGSE